MQEVKPPEVDVVRMAGWSFHYRDLAFADVKAALDFADTIIERELKWEAGVHGRPQVTLRADDRYPNALDVLQAVTDRALAAGGSLSSGGHRWA